GDTCTVDYTIRPGRNRARAYSTFLPPTDVMMAECINAALGQSRHQGSAIDCLEQIHVFRSALESDQPIFGHQLFCEPANLSDWRVAFVFVTYWYHNTNPLPKSAESAILDALTLYFPCSRAQ